MVTLWDKAQLIKINAYKKKVGNFNIGIDKEIPEKKRLLGHKYKDISSRGATAQSPPRVRVNSVLRQNLQAFTPNMFFRKGLIKRCFCVNIRLRL